MALKPVTSPDVEAPAIELTIDGQPVQAKGGVSLYDVISQTGKIIPAMCYHYTFDPFGSCGMCLVMVEGKKAPVRSCTAKAEAGMVVRCEGDDLFAARKKAVEKHLTIHPLDCPVCDADGHCELQDTAFQHGVTNLVNAKPKGLPEDRRSLVLDFNMNRCILCGECINICKDVQMVDALQFFKKEGTTHVVAKGDKGLTCEFCGDCLAVCPVGAITNKYSKYVYKPWQLKKTTSTCAYCADGCQMHIETSGKGVQRVTSPLSWKNKWGDRAETAKGHGGLCVRGRFGFQYIDSAERLGGPLVRTDEGLVSKSWFEAMDVVAGRLKAIKARYGPDAIAGLITARCTNEELYLFQKLMRAAIGTAHVDSSARYGHLNFTRALQQAAGIGRMMNGYEQITKANVLLLIGTDITETNPIAGLRVKEALRVYGAQVLVAASRMTNIAKLATHPLPIAAGSEGWVIKALVKAVVEEDLVEEAAVAAAPEAFAALKQAVAGLSWELLAARTGLSREAAVEAARLYAEAPRAVILCAEGVTRQADGYANVLNLVDLAWVTGKLAKPGCGVNALPEEANEQGAVDMGVAPELLPGQAPYADEAARARFASAWNVTLPAGPGASLMEMLERCRRGEIKALYLVGENPLATLPESTGVREALEKVELLISQDPFLTETGRLAHVVLPACTFAEKDGTFTNLEGKVNRVRPALDSYAEAHPDWEIFAALGTTLGYPMEYDGPQAVQREIMKLLPGYYNLGEAKPLTANPDAYLRNGYVREVAARYAAGAAIAKADRPFALTVGQVLYHSGKLSTRASGLVQLAPSKGRLQMNAADLARLQVGANDAVRVTSAKATVELRTEPNPDLAPGTCFFPEHYNEPPVKDLAECVTDPTTGVPTFKFVRVAIEKI
ncbi:MAG: 4Fe-4S dicluster domain-containing protein [Nitrospirae bacterium]|nr:MAG: 4Fe-4S dicluster domain-containing protein [Nitrospirota bacterium]